MEPPGPQKALSTERDMWLSGEGGGREVEDLLLKPEPEFFNFKGAQELIQRN